MKLYVLFGHCLLHFQSQSRPHRLLQHQIWEGRHHRRQDLNPDGGSGTFFACFTPSECPSNACSLFFWSSATSLTGIASGISSAPRSFRRAVEVVNDRDIREGRMLWGAAYGLYEDGRDDAILWKACDLLVTTEKEQTSFNGNRWTTGLHRRSWPDAMLS